MDSFHLPVKSHGSDSSTGMTALTVSLVPATALLSVEGLCVHVPWVPSAGLWGHPQMSQGCTFFGNNTVLDCLSDSLYLLHSSLLYPGAKGYFPLIG